MPDPVLTMQEAATAVRAEQSTPVDPATPASDSTAPTPPAQDTASTAGAPVESVEPLVSDEEFTAIQTSFPNDAVKQREALNKAWTQKTQKRAADLKQLEKLAPHAELIEALETDGVGTLTQLAAQFGLDVTPKTPAAKATQTATETAKTAALDATALFKQSLGPELDFLADKIGPAVQQMAEAIAQQVVTKSVAPMQEAQQALTTRAATEQAEHDLALFGQKHPDWSTHDAAMTALASKLTDNGKQPPPASMSSQEWLEMLYRSVTYDTVEQTAAKKALDRVKRSAETADPSMATTTAAAVSTTAPGKLSIREAYLASKAEATRR